MNQKETDLKTQLAACDISYMDIARRVGKAYSSVSGWINGYQTMPADARATIEKMIEEKTNDPKTIDQDKFFKSLGIADADAEFLKKYKVDEVAALWQLHDEDILSLQIVQDAVKVLLRDLVIWGS
jgi:hypothetical protein